MRAWVLFGILLASLVCQLVGLVMFAKGFFPYKAISTSFASLEELPLLPSLAVADQFLQGQVPDPHQPGTVKPRFGKVVLMLVDALRSDFVYGNESDFKFMQSLIENHKAIPFTALASAPTVTLPRLKALTTGTVPGFLDAILNIAESDQSSTLANQDNWIAQLARSPSHRANAIKTGERDSRETVEKRKIAFFGDDTWIKLFPGLFFRSEGTSSFFAMDTVEVDNNVTRHVEPELAKDDWDGLIFHYLGLDHVGHSGGPKSALMRPKQAEMDTIAKTIYKTLVAKDSVSVNMEQELPTLFVLCGDHGMNEVGNHGGSSRSEISTTFLFMSSLFEHAQAQADIQSMVEPYRQAKDNEEYQFYRSVSQVDLVPTLSLLMGLPIPKNSVGKLIPELFSGHTDTEKLRALQINAHQVASVLKAMWSDFEVESAELLRDYVDPELDQEVSQDAEQGIRRCSREKSQKQRLACWYTLALADHASFLEMGNTERTGVHYQHSERTRKFQAADKAYSKFLEDASSMLSTTLSKYDMPLLTNGSLMMAFAVAGLFYCAMQTSLLDDFKASCLEPRLQALDSGSSVSSERKRQLPNTLSSYIAAMFQGGHHARERRVRKRDRNDINWVAARILSVVIMILYLVTLFASSFVEEEHQFWYFFNMTWWVVLALTSGSYLRTATVLPTFKKEGEPEDEASRERGGQSSAAAAGYCLLQMAILRLLRSWNQTGQKYADQIDLRYYFNSSWTGFSWILFWISMALVATSMISLVFALHSPFGSPLRLAGHQNGQPAWRAALISVLQALLTVLIVLASLWITVYKMDLESAHFGPQVMERVHMLMSALSSVGYSSTNAAEVLQTGQERLTMSGFEMARGCYAALGAIVLLTSILKYLISSVAPTSTFALPPAQGRSRTDAAAPLQQEWTKPLFEPSMLLGTATLLLVLLSRRHNAPLFVLFGVQLYLYLNWISLIRQRDPASQDQNNDGEDKDYPIFVQEYDGVDGVDGASAEGVNHKTMASASNASSALFRTSPGQNSIHSCTIILWTLSSFFIFGNSNSIASIDISNAYVGIRAYDIVLTGILTFISNWAGPIWWCLAAVIVIKWDIEMELAWATEDKEIRLLEEEERGWKNVHGWKRDDKRTWSRKTKRRIQLYKRALDKSREARKKEDETNVQNVLSAEKIASKDVEQVDNAGLDAVDEDTAAEPSVEGFVQNLESLQDPQEDQDQEDSFYIYEQQSVFVEDSSIPQQPSTGYPCVLADVGEFRRRLTQTRILDHLILTSLFFGITLYVLSIAAIILRHHLFIWTVFSPKVLYQFAWTVLFQIGVQVLGVGVGVWSLMAIV
ncbi:hypothetical protein EDD21DRAFT_156427 [Dissophora ornata]|nr:hypothetical protein EDD21DRAFT_156427 [Dissophora ornata]